MQQVHFEEIVKLQSRGNLTIPKQLRKYLRLEKNSLIRVIKERNRLILEPVRMITYPVRSYSDKELKDFFAYDSEQTKKLKKNGIL
jgi:AbrB family looped-hinge helix DNA binding protein